jgi:DNA-binding response OmpR family regulator
MAVERRTTVLVVEADASTRTLYGHALLAADYMMHAVSSLPAAEVAARGTHFDIIVVDSTLDESALAVIERLAALPKRPRLVAVTSRVPNGAPLEWLFDIYFEKPCPPEALVDAVQSVQIPTTKQDLLIVARDRVGIDDILQRFGGNTASIEVRLDLRRGQRRRHARFRTRSERRRAERRAHDVDHWLRSDGWAFVPAANRS